MSRQWMPPGLTLSGGALSGGTTHKARSLSGLSTPRAADPDRYTRSG